MTEKESRMIVPVKCGRCKAVGATRDNCRLCGGFKFRCFHCDNRVYPDLQYALTSDCLCVEPVKQNQPAKLP